MSNLLLKALLASAAVSLGGCTIYVTSGPPPKDQQQTATRKKAKPTAAKPASTTTTPAQDTTTKPTADAPRIKGFIPFGNGNAGAFRGLAYVIPADTQKVPDLSKSTPFASLLTDSFIVQPQEFSGGFPGVLIQEEWFAIRYDGAFEVPKDATYVFKLVSDDGAILYIDGEKVADNDGVHTAKDVTGRKLLKAGKHQLRLDYFQAKKGQIALSLLINADGEQPKPLVGSR